MSVLNLLNHKGIPQNPHFDWGRLGTGILTGGASEIARASAAPFQGAPPPPPPPPAVDQAKAALVDQSRIPGFQGNTSFGNDGQLKSYLKLGQYDPRGLAQLRADALRAPGQQSAWAGIANQQNQFQTTNQVNQAAQQGASNIANARSQVAMGGGLRSGAAARMALGGANQLGVAQQGARNQGAQNALGISLQDENNRRADLGGLAAQEAAYQAPDRFNIANTLTGSANNQQQQNQFNLAKYGLSNDAYGKLIQGNAADQAAQKQPGMLQNFWSNYVG